MRKKTFVLIVFIFFLFYFLYKGCYLFYYNINNITVTNYKKIINNIGNQNNITIKNNRLDEEQYLQINDIKIKNDFNDFKKISGSENETDKYLLYDNDNKVKAAFWMEVTDSYVEKFKTDKTLFGVDNKKISSKYITNFFKDNNIKNDIDLFNFLKEKKDVKNNIFTTVNKMKENYMIQYFTVVSMPTIDGITLINGDYSGYILNLTSSGKEVSILKGNKRYAFIFLHSKYFTDECINDLISTIII